MPSSSPANRMNRIVRRGFKPDALIVRSASTTKAALHPLSRAPVPSSHESRCAPRITNSSGRSLPLISPTTLDVVGEIKGSERPDEFVILGAHLDSWELGTGALDNGCNAALVVDALRTIKASGLKPRRTIRFILFAGEEEGMMGSRAYATAHRSELDKAAGVAIIDSGIGHVTGFTLGGRKDMANTVAAIVAPLKAFGADALTTDEVEWGTDNFDFLLEGVPTIVANQEEGNYLVNYHAVSDTFDKVDIPTLKRHTAEMTVLAFGIANARDRIGARLTRSQIDKILRDTHADEQLKPLGIWTEWASGKRGRQ